MELASKNIQEQIIIFWLYLSCLRHDGDSFTIFGEILRLNNVSWIILASRVKMPESSGKEFDLFLKKRIFVMAAFMDGQGCSSGNLGKKQVDAMLA